MKLFCNETNIEIPQHNKVYHSKHIYYMATNQDILDYLSKIFRSGDATTPKHIVDAMLDLIPDEVFRDPAKTFLCPATKDGVFLREILQRILKAYKTNDETRIRKVLETRVFGIALTFKDYMMSRRTLYGCTDDDNETGYRDIDNIFYDTTETLSEPQKDKLGNTFPYQYTVSLRSSASCPVCPLTLPLPKKKKCTNQANAD
ncbi:hypothetical protein AGMMS50239_27690 [Bacteroidia bacterium]|nr:hypothetical protein AGMMS50239_27690 [Bacteroidia bacterium]